MTIEPHLIRSERYHEIGGLIQRDAGLLIERWRRRAVAEEKSANQVHREALLDHLPVFLWELGRSLTDSDTSDNGAHCRPARQHGAQRWEVGWSLPEVVRDYQILRLVILEYLEEALERSLRQQEVLAVGLALDDAITASVVMYVHQREEYIKQVERERAEEVSRAAADLQEAQRRKDEFLAVLAHELRNFLAPARNAVELLRYLPADSSPLREATEVLERQTRHMGRVVDDLLDVARIARGQVTLRKAPTDLGAIVTQAVQSSEPLIQEHRHRLTITQPPEPLWVEADAARLVQILTNLLNNAAKYTPPGGHVHVTLERTGGDVVLRVRDTGRGITPEQIGRIFDPFLQLEPTTDQSNGGLGIGLALVRRLAELHGGTVTANSDGPGRGSEFVVRLPALTQAPSAPAAPARPAPASSSSRRILLVEDNPDGRKTLLTLLRLWGHQVEAAADGPQGVDLALASPPEVALIDLGLPTLDGFQVAQQLRAQLGQAVCLIALTGYGQEEDRRRTLEAGFNAHLVKPVNPEELSQLLADLPLASG